MEVEERVEGGGGDVFGGGGGGLNSTGFGCVSGGMGDVEAVRAGIREGRFSSWGGRGKEDLRFGTAGSKSWRLESCRMGFGGGVAFILGDLDNGGLVVDADDTAEAKVLLISVSASSLLEKEEG